MKYFLLTILFAFTTATLFPVESQVGNTVYKEGLKKYILLDFEGAIADFEHAHKLNPDDEKARKMLSNALIKLGTVQFEKGDYEKSETNFIRALSLSTNHENVLPILAQIRNRMQQLKSTGSRPAETKITGNNSTPRKRTEPKTAGPREILFIDVDEFASRETDLASLALANSLQLDSEKKIDLAGLRKSERSYREAVSIPWRWLALTAVAILICLTGLVILFIRRNMTKVTREQAETPKAEHSEAIQDQDLGTRRLLLDRIELILQSKPDVESVNAIRVLLPFLTDQNDEIRNRTRTMLEEPLRRMRQEEAEPQQEVYTDIL